MSGILTVTFTGAGGHRESAGQHPHGDLDRGDLTAPKDAITDLAFAECWSLDETGNWKNFRQDDDGNGTWDLNQNRSANTVNEITDISESAGPSWVTPAYNKAGNMTTLPQPADPTTSYTATYDAWNRLMKLVDDSTSDTVSQYAYDAAKRRILQETYAGGVLDQTRHLYYTEPSKWQVVEERVDSSTDAERQFVWGLRYIDDILLRDRDTTGNGTLDERLYGLQDANWNVTSIADVLGDIQEHYAYSAYGVPAFLTPAFGTRPSSNFDWETLFAGYRWYNRIPLFQVRHRIYNSVAGIWLQRDLVPFADTHNLYQYALSRPLQFTDPSGLYIPGLAGCVIGILFGGVAGGATGGWRGAVCGALGGCITGGLIELLAETGFGAAHPVLAACAATALGTLIASLCADSCDFSDSCVYLTTALGLVVGCAAGFGGDLTEQLTAWVLSVYPGILGGSCA